jgi:ATP-binding cassette, subfamily B, bacterial
MASGAFLSRLKAGFLHLRALPRAIQMAWRSGRWLTVAWVTMLVVEAVLPAVLFYTIRALINLLTAGSATIATTAPHLGLIAAFLVGREVVAAGSSIVRGQLSQTILDQIKGQIHEKATMADYAQFEDSHFFDRLYRANYQSGEATVAVVESVGSCLRGTVSLIAMIVILLPFAIWLPGALLLSMLPVAYVVIVHAFRYHQWWQLSTERERRAEYYDWLMTSAE